MSCLAGTEWGRGGGGGVVRVEGKDAVHIVSDGSWRTEERKGGGL